VKEKSGSLFNNRKFVWISGIVLIVLITGVGLRLSAKEIRDASRNRVYRLYNQTTGEHFFTANKTERYDLEELGWEYEGIAWYAPTSGDPVYRLCSMSTGEHYYTISKDEKDSLVGDGWMYEGIGWYSSASKKIPVYSEFNPNVPSGGYNYTTSFSEHLELLDEGWENKNIVWYAEKKGKRKTKDEKDDNEVRTQSDVTGLSY
jgi:hypothetical protein